MSGTHPVKVIVFWLLLIALMVSNVPARAELDWVRVTTEYAPPRTDGHQMIFNTHDGIAIMFGGIQVDNRAQPLYFYDGLNWEKLPSSGDWPSWRSNFGMAYDASRDVVVVFGGFQGGFDYLGDTWEWDGTQWEEKQPVDSPVDRIRHSMTYHGQLEKVVLFGGYTENLEPTNELWIWDGINWEEITPRDSPVPRFASPIVYDNFRNIIALFGGTEDGNNKLSDTWEWDGYQWEHITTPHFPTGKRGHVFVFDTSRQVSVLFGGNDDPSGLSNKTWEYDGSDWTEMQTIHRPSKRGSTAACYDSVHQGVILYGGNTEFGSNDETWEYYDVPTPTPSPTPTITPSPTITPTPVPTCTPTATPIDGVLLTLHLPEEPIHAGDTFYLDVTISNANPDPLTDIPLFVILEAAGTFWYHPAWSMEPSWQTLSIIPTGSMGVTILSPFEWADNAGNGTARFWGAVTDQEMTPMDADSMRSSSQSAKSAKSAEVFNEKP